MTLPKIYISMKGIVIFMGYIYKITNKINGKIYIGQTRNSIKTRMSKHYSKAKTGEGKTGIDAAIRKYGKENFEVKQICECPNEDLDEQEKFYIAKYKSYEDGYNLTTGSQSGTTWLNLNEKEVIEKYNEIKVIYKVADYFDCSEKIISNILHNNNIKIFTYPTLKNLFKGKKFKEGDGTKKVLLIELNKEFASLKECSQWLIDNKYSKASTMELARKSLSRALNGDRSTYCGFHFKFID